MDNAFAWIGAIVEWFGKFIPRVVIVKSTHGGVKFVYGRKVKRMGPGVHIFWPLVTEILQLPTARTTHNLVTQTLLTKDGRQVVVGVVVVYSITDVVLALSEVWDVSDAVSDIAQCAVVGVMAGNDFDIIVKGICSDIEQELTKATRERLKTFGIKVHKCSITDFSPCQVYRVISDSPTPVPLVPNG